MSNLRLLIAADSGTGKTGALWSLIQAGYSLRIADFDNGCDFLRIRMAEALAKLPEADRPEFRSRLSIVTCRENMRTVGGDITLEEPLGYTRFISAISNWPGYGKSLNLFGPKDVFVIDTLNFMCRAVMWRLLHLNKTVNKRIEPRDYNLVQNDIRTVLDRIISDQLQCAIVVNTHLDYKEYREGTYFNVGMMERDITGTDEKRVSTAETEVKGTPTAFGAALGPKVGGWFNFMLTCRSRKVGSTTKRVIVTAPDEIVDCKVPFTDLPDELPLETGLATIFKKWEGIQQLLKEG